LHDENIKLEQNSQSIPAIRAEMHCKNKILYDENLKLRREIERCRKIIGDQKKDNPDIFDIDTQSKTSDNVSSTDNALYQKLLNLQNTLTNNQTIIEKQRRSQFQRDQAYGKLKSELNVLQDKLEHAYNVIQNLEEVSARERKKYEEKISSESKISKFKTQRTEMFLTELLRIFPSTKDFVRDFFNTDDIQTKSKSYGGESDGYMDSGYSPMASSVSSPGSTQNQEKTLSPTNTFQKFQRKKSLNSHSQVFQSNVQFVLKHQFLDLENNKINCLILKIIFVFEKSGTLAHDLTRDWQLVLGDKVHPNILSCLNILAKRPDFRHLSNNDILANRNLKKIFSYKKTNFFALSFIIRKAKPTLQKWANILVEMPMYSSHDKLEQIVDNWNF